MDGDDERDTDLRFYGDRCIRRQSKERQHNGDEREALTMGVLVELAEQISYFPHPGSALEARFPQTERSRIPVPRITWGKPGKPGGDPGDLKHAAVVPAEY